MNEITVKELLKLCQEQVSLGNGDKHIQISEDDEGNGYHGLFFGFTSEKEEIQELQAMGLFHDNIDPDKVVILG